LFPLVDLPSNEYPITTSTRHEITVPKTNRGNYLVYFVLKDICPMWIIVGCVDALWGHMPLEAKQHQPFAIIVKGENSFFSYTRIPIYIQW
jgi:hypothetical protein